VTAQKFWHAPATKRPASRPPQQAKQGASLGLTPVMGRLDLLRLSGATRRKSPRLMQRP